MTANGLPPLSLLAGYLAPASLVGYGRDLAAYARFCTSDTLPLKASSRVAWRTYLPQYTAVSPHTIRVGNSAKTPPRQIRATGHCHIGNTATCLVPSPCPRDHTGGTPQPPAGCPLGDGSLVSCRLHERTRSRRRYSRQGEPVEPGGRSGNTVGRLGRFRMRMHPDSGHPDNRTRRV
jgi:hypothetical protein